MSRPGITFDVLTSLEQLEAHEPVLRAVFDASDASPYYSYEWLHAYLQYRPVPDEPFICVCRDHGQAIAVVPLAVQRGPLATCLVPYADGPANVNTGCCIAGATRLPLLQLAAEWLSKRHVAWDRFSFAKVSAASCLHQHDGLISGGLSVVATAAPPSLVIDLPQTWDEYLSSRSKSQRRNIMQHTRTVGATGGLALARVGLDGGADPALVDRVIEDALQVSGRSWQGVGADGHAICHGRWADFFRESCRRLSRRGMLDLGLLYLGERPIAFSWAHARNGVSWCATSGFDEAYRRGAPGVALDALLIRDSIGRGMTRLDWGPEFPDYKRPWATGIEPMVELSRSGSSTLAPLKWRMQQRWNRSVAPRLEQIRCAFHRGLLSTWGMDLCWELPYAAPF